MIVTVTTSGGWADLHTVATLDASTLPQAEAAELAAAIASFQRSPPADAPDARDARTFTVQLDGDGAGFSFSEARPPAGLEPLMRLRGTITRHPPMRS